MSDVGGSGGVRQARAGRRVLALFAGRPARWVRSLGADPMRALIRASGRHVPLGGAVVAAAALVVIVAAGALAGRDDTGPIRIDVTIRDSHYDPASITVPAGRDVTFVIHNMDPIDHEWILGDAAVHAMHRTGTEAVHVGRANELSIAALATVETTLSFAAPRSDLTYVCHLPGHEAYGMVGTLIVTH